MLDVRKEAGPLESEERPTRQRSARGQAALVELITALEAELVEERERAERLEERINRLEQQLAPFVPAEPDHQSRDQEEPVGKTTRSTIDAWRWDDADERAYWLRRCEGFRVRDSSGVLGHVDSVRFLRELEEPDTLVVLNKRWPRRECMIAVSEIAEIAPERREIMLAVPALDWLLPSRPGLRSRIHLRSH
jgi:hypothetical protein